MAPQRTPPRRILALRTQGRPRRPRPALTAGEGLSTTHPRSRLPLGDNGRGGLPRTAPRTETIGRRPHRRRPPARTRDPRRVDPRLGTLPPRRARTRDGTGHLPRHLRSRLPPRPRLPLRRLTRRPTSTGARRVPRDVAGTVWPVAAPRPPATVPLADVRPRMQHPPTRRRQLDRQRRGRHASPPTNAVGAATDDEATGDVVRCRRDRRRGNRGRRRSAGHGLGPVEVTGGSRALW